MTNLRAWAIDTAERVGFTFAEAYLGAVMLEPYTGLSSIKAAASAGVIAAVCYLKSQVALLIPDTVSPASLVRKPVSAALPAPPGPNAGTMQVGGALVTITVLPGPPGGSA